MKWNQRNNMLEAALACPGLLIYDEINNYSCFKKPVYPCTVQVAPSKPFCRGHSWDISPLSLTGKPNPQSSPGSMQREPGFITSSLGCQGQHTLFRQTPGKAPIGPAPAFSHPGNVRGKIRVPKRRMRLPSPCLHPCTCCQELGQPVPAAARHPCHPQLWPSFHFCLR